MKAATAIEMLEISRTRFAQLVQKGRIRVINHSRGASGSDYNDRDVERLLAERRRQGHTKAPKTLLTPKVRDAVAYFQEAIDEALTTGDLTRDEAAGKLSLLISELWEQCEGLTERLPGKLKAA